MWTQKFRRWVERQLSQRPLHDEEDVTLTYAGSRRVVDWAIRKSRVADGTRPFHPVLPANRVEAAVTRVRKRGPSLLGHFKRAAKSAWGALRAGVLRMLAGCTLREIGLRSDRHRATAGRDLADHRRLLAEPGYRKLTSLARPRVACGALTRLDSAIRPGDRSVPVPGDAANSRP